MNIKNENTNNTIAKNIFNDNISSEALEMEENNSFSFNTLLKDIGRQSLKAIKWFVIVLLLFILSNIIFILISVFKEERTNLGTLLVVLVGLFSVVFSLYCTYKYILIDTLHIAYKYLTPLFRKICVKIIDKVVASGNKLLGKRDIDQMLNVGALMIEVYGKKLPSYLQKAVIFILKRVPFSDFLFNMQDDLKNGRKDTKTLSEILYQQLDSFITNTFFLSNSMKWIMWFLPLNIIIQIVLLVYLK